MKREGQSAALLKLGDEHMDIPHIILVHLCIVELFLNVFKLTK